MSFDSSWALSDSQSSPDSSSHSHRKRRHPERDDDDSDQAEVWSDDDEAERETRFERGGEGLDWGDDAGARREDHKRKRNDSRASREDRPPAFPPSSSSSSNAVASGLTTSYSPSLGPQSTPLSRIARTIQPRPSFTSPTPPDSSSSSSAPRRAPSSSSLVPPSSPIALPDYANSAQPYRRRNPSSSLPLSLRRPPLVRNASAVPDPAPYLRTSQPSNNDSSYFQSSSSSLSSSSRAYGFRTSAEPSWSSSSSQPSSQLHSPWLERRPGSLDSSGRLRGPSRVANEHWLGIPRNASTFAWPSVSPSTRALSGVVETGETSRSFELGGYERAGSGRSGRWQEGLEGQASSSSSSVETNLGQHNVDQSLHHLESQRFLLSSSTSARRSATLQPRWLPFGSASSGLAEVDEAHPLPSSSLTSNTDNPPTSSTSRSQHPLPPSYPYSLNPHASSTTPLASTSSRGFVFEDSVEPLSTPSERVTREDRRSSSPGETTAGRSTLRRRGAWQIADEGEPTTSASIPSFHAIQLDHPSLSSRRRAHSVSQTSQRERLSIFSPDSDTDSDDPPFASSSRDPPPFSTSSRLPIMLASGSLGHRSTSLDESRSMDLDGTPAQALSHRGSMSSTLRRRGPGSRQNAEGDVDQDQEDGDAVGGDNSRREDAGTGSSRLAHFLSRHEERRRDLLSEATHSLLAAPTMSRTLASSGHHLSSSAMHPSPPSNVLPPSVWDALLQNHANNRRSPLPPPLGSSSPQQPLRSIRADFPVIFANPADPSSDPFASSRSASSAAADAAAAHEAFSVASLQAWQSRVRAPLSERTTPAALPFSTPGPGARFAARGDGRPFPSEAVNELLQEVDDVAGGAADEVRELSWIETELARIRRENRELFGEGFPPYGREDARGVALGDLFAGVRGRGDYMMDDELDLSYEGLTALSARIGLGRPLGVSAAVLASLQSGRYGEFVQGALTGGKTLEEIDSRCAVCYDEYAAEDVTLSMNACSHFFHEPCLKEWLSSHNTCPICRSRCRSHASADPDVELTEEEATEAMLDEVESAPLLGGDSTGRDQRQAESGAAAWESLRWR